MKKINLSRRYRKVSVFSQKVKAQAGRDVSVFGGPGSGRYPRGSGKNPQASKRNPDKFTAPNGKRLNEIGDVNKGKPKNPTAEWLISDFDNTTSKTEKKNILQQALDEDAKRLQKISNLNLIG